MTAPDLIELRSGAVLLTVDTRTGIVTGAKKAWPFVYAHLTRKPLRDTVAGEHTERTRT